MTTKELKEYLSMAMDMEKNIYLQERMIERLNAKSAPLGIPKDIPEPVPAATVSYWRSPGADTAGNAVKGLVYGAIGGLVLGFFVFSHRDTDLHFFLGLLLLSAIGAVLGLAAGLLFAKGENSYADRENTQRRKDALRNADRRDQAEMAAYRKAKRADDLRVQRENLKKASYIRDRDRLQQLHVDSIITRAKFYAQGTIHPKYQNLPCVCTLYEYLDTGRCTELGGHEGAYNLLELESRLDRIITQNDQIIAQLDKIERNQHTLYEEVRSLRYRMDDMLDSADRIAGELQDFRGDAEALKKKADELNKTSKLTAYNTEQVQKQLEYQNRIKYLEDRKNGTFWAPPPTGQNPPKK